MRISISRCNGYGYFSMKSVLSFQELSITFLLVRQCELLGVSKPKLIIYNAMLLRRLSFRTLMEYSRILISPRRYHFSRLITCESMWSWLLTVWRCVFDVRWCGTLLQITLEGKFGKLNVFFVDRCMCFEKKFINLFKNSIKLLVYWYFKVRRICIFQMRKLLTIFADTYILHMLTKM